MKASSSNHIRCNFQELDSKVTRLSELEKAQPSSPAGGASPSAGGNLQQQIVKLKAQVKFGEDALKAEQDQVKQLQQQLTQQKQVSSACGSVDVAPHS